MARGARPPGRRSDAARGRARAAGFGLALVALLPEWLAGSPALAGRPREQSVVVSGFSPVEVSGTHLTLGDRRYLWNGTYLPTLRTGGNILAAPMALRLDAGGQRTDLVPTDVNVVAEYPHAVTLEAVGEPYPNLQVKVTTRVEYDGVGMVTIVLTPLVPVEVDGLDFEVEVRSNPATRMLRFRASDLRDQSRDQPIEPSYAGAFLNAVGFADGDRSFWWFADDAEGWVWNGATVTEVEPIAADRILLRQRLIGARHSITAPITMRMNFLATPVKELGSAWRRERITAGASSAEAAIGRIQGWWSTAFAHTALPYTEPPPAVLTLIPAVDFANYPGLEANRLTLLRNLSKAIYSLPYFSAHCLTEIDPALNANRGVWEVQPPYVVTSVVPSYPTPFAKPVLSHRSSTYGDYVLGRLDEEIDKLGLSGIYLDHASVMDSRSPHHAWIDSNGVLQPATDILGMRSFLKSLRTLFHLKGEPGLVFVHASNSELIPAYTFATGIADGEHFRDRLVDEDYIGSVPIDQVRLQHAPGQYGVRNVWIPQFDVWKGGDPTWPGSEEERRAFRNFMTLVLLHDAEFWPVFVPQDERVAVVSALDAFGVSSATFRGYWSQSIASTSHAQAVVSVYQRDGKLLLVVGNLGTSAATVDVEVDLAVAGLAFDATARLVPDDAPLAFADGRLDVAVPGRDFRLVALE